MATLKGCSTDTLHTIRNLEACNVATSKCTLADACYTRRNYDICNVVAIIERIITDVRGTAGEFNCFNIVFNTIPRCF